MARAPFLDHNSIKRCSSGFDGGYRGLRFLLFLLACLFLLAFFFFSRALISHSTKSSRGLIIIQRAMDWIKDSIRAPIMQLEIRKDYGYARWGGPPRMPEFPETGQAAASVAPQPGQAGVHIRECHVAVSCGETNIIRRFRVQLAPEIRGERTVSFV
jgi:hypothetical protein